MSRMPKTSLPAGHDTHGKPVKLGDIDSDGYPVVYIAPDGLAHESRKMAEFSPLFGRFSEALGLHLAGMGPQPDPDEFIAAHCSPEFAAEAFRWLREQTAFWLKMRCFVLADPHVFMGSFPMPAGVSRTGAW